MAWLDDGKISTSLVHLVRLPSMHVEFHCWEFQEEQQKLAMNELNMNAQYFHTCMLLFYKKYSISHLVANLWDQINV